jgi:hypothetical protein
LDIFPSDFKLDACHLFYLQVFFDVCGVGYVLFALVKAFDDLEDEAVGRSGFEADQAGLAPVRLKLLGEVFLGQAVKGVVLAEAGEMLGYNLPALHRLDFQPEGGRVGVVGAVAKAQVVGLVVGGVEGFEKGIYLTPNLGEYLFGNHIL